MPTFTIDAPIGTSDPLDLCEGLQLFPGVKPARAGLVQSQHSKPLFDTGITVLFSRLKASAYYEFLMGLCGPAIAFLFEDVTVTTGDTPDNQGQVTLDFANSTQEMQVGAFMGMLFGGGVHVVEQEYLPSSWLSPWKFKWKTLFDARIGFEIDFIELFFELIAFLLDQSAEDGLIEKDTGGTLSKIANKISSFKFFGESSAGLFPGNAIAAEAKLSFPIDLVEGTAVLRGFVAGLHKIKGDMKFGPALVLGMPVDMSLNQVTIAGGQGPHTSADYTYQTQSNTSWTAVGPAFTATPQQLTTRVSYTAGLEVGISCYFSLSACKIFHVSVNSASLDLIHLFQLPTPTTAKQYNTVGTSLAGAACVLVPLMTLDFSDDPALTTVPVTGTVRLTDPVTSASPLVVTLTTDPPMPGFPGQVRIQPGQSAATFTYTFANQCVLSGDPNDPTATQSPSPTTLAATVNVTASAQFDPPPSCGPATVEVTTTLKVQNNIVVVQLASGTLGTSPAWADETVGGAALNANPSLPPSDPSSNATTLVLGNAVPPPTAPTPVKFTLLDETRQPHTSSNVRLTVGGASAVLAPSATLQIPPPLHTFLTIEWLSAGPQVNYSSRFILVVDAGCEFGQTEFWLDVWNWS